MPTIGPGVQEIRIHVKGEHRVFYVATFKDAVYVLHVFQKETRKTSTQDVDLGRQRFRELVKMRQQRDAKKRT